MKLFPLCGATKKQIARSTQTYNSNHRYNIHKHMNTNTYVTMTQWWNNHAQEIYRTKYKDEVYPTVILCKIQKHNNADTIITCTKISIQTKI